MGAARQYVESIARAFIDAPENSPEECALRDALDCATERLEYDAEELVRFLCDDGSTPARSAPSVPELPAGRYSAFVVMENGWWEQPTYRVPAGWTELEVVRAITADPSHRYQVLFVTHLGPDPDCPEEDARALPDVEVEPEARVPHPPVETLAMPVLSTQHLTCREAQRSAGSWPRHCHESEHGFVAHFGTVKELRDIIDETDEVVDDWPGLQACAEWAEAHGFAWLRFDADGPVQENLPKYEW